MFTIHKGILCKDSSYFLAALNGNFKEALENKITLPEDHAEIFQIFQQWAYSGSMRYGDTDEAALSTALLIVIYTFAEARDIPKLQNQALDAIITRHKNRSSITAAWLFITYDNTCPSSPLRKYIADFCASNRASPTDSWLKKGRDSIPHDFAIDLALALHGLQAYTNKYAGCLKPDFWEERHKYHVPLEEASSFQNRTEEHRLATVDEFVAGIPAA